ncbi:acyltransferase family protein [Pontibacter pamirensis]|uniref:acyltransferase family protein n=1 Tax=Pontibacter pamirensis TaxID=2562824 RepID=UPI00138A3FBA|nr:acyltransferase [Pontibacter pamirensis]
MKIKVLDGLRGYAALSIIIAHSPLISGPAIIETLHGYVQHYKLAYLGVDVFFVLSGFLITRILLKEKAEGRFSFRTFYLKRCLRIFPVYYLVMLICGVLFTWQGMDYVSLYWSNYYFALNQDPHPLRHTWSLAVEEHFYLVWPALLYFFSLRRAKQVILFGIPALVVLSLFYTYSQYNALEAEYLIYKGSQFRILSLAIGSCFAFKEKTIRNISPKNQAFLLLLFAVTYVLAVKIKWTFLVNYIPSQALLLSLFAIASASIFLLVLQFEKRQGLIHTLLTNKLISFIGMISYGLYLYHFPIFYFFGITQKQLQGEAVSLGSFILPLLLVFLIPVVSYYVVEKPLLKLKDRIEKKKAAVRELVPS